MIRLSIALRLLALPLHNKIPTTVKIAIVEAMA
jgi:hypothetical protein